jgi:hypothetical protein
MFYSIVWQAHVLKSGRVCAAVYRYRAAGEHPITSDLLKVRAVSADQSQWTSG